MWSSERSAGILPLSNGSLLMQSPGQWTYGSLFDIGSICQSEFDSSAVTESLG